MQTIGFCAPILPGKTELDRETHRSLTRERKEDFEASRRSAGITRETSWIQSTPEGDFAVVVIEAKDLDAAFTHLATSTEPFDVWFRERIEAVHGFSLEDGIPQPELVLDFRA